MAAVLVPTGRRLSPDRDLPAAGTTPPGQGRVVAGVDDSPSGLAALRWAVTYARSHEMPLVAVRAWDLGLPRHGRRWRRWGYGHVVLVFDGTVAQQTAAKLAARALRAAGSTPGDPEVTVETPRGDPGTVLSTAASASGDVLIVGTRSAHGLHRVLHGSVSAYCARHASSPVFVISRPPRWGRADAAGRRAAPMRPWLGS